MQDLRIAQRCISTRLVNGTGAMSTCRFKDRAPESVKITAYDESHARDYLRLLDADAEGADWRDVAATIFGIDAAIEPERARSEEHTSELQSLMRISYAVFCLKKKQNKKTREPQHSNLQH